MTTQPTTHPAVVTTEAPATGTAHHDERAYPACGAHGGEVGVMGLIANGTKPIGVLRNPVKGDGLKWLVCCAICKPGLLFDIFGSTPGPVTTTSTIAHSPDWSRAVEWAHIHASQHEATRCQHCNHLPTRAVETDLFASREARP